MTPQAGLDLAALRALRPPRHDVENITARIRDHLDHHDGYIAFSGGKDSTVTLHLALRADPNVPVVFFDSGFEFPETYTYIAQLRDSWGLSLHWINARHTTLELLVASRAWQHPGQPDTALPHLFDVLIAEPARRAHQEHGPGELWGVRAAESKGRAALYASALRAECAHSCRGCCDTPRIRRRTHGGLIRRVDGTVAYGPVWDWSDKDVWAYLHRNRLPINPVYERLRAIGAPPHFQRVSHVLDGTRLQHGRVTFLRRGWPDLFEDLAQVLPRLREYV